jgi:hypothetical protein
MSQGVIYQLSGPSHAYLLAASLWALRQFYDGSVTICHTRACRHVAKQIASDDRIHADTQLIRLVPECKRPHSITKTSTFLQSPYDHTVFLDADVFVRVPIDDLWNCDNAYVQVSEFSNLVSGSDAYAKHRWNAIRYVRKYSDYLNDLVIKCETADLPLVNTGVVVFRKPACHLANIHLLALSGRNWSMRDEVATNLMLPTVQDLTILPPEWNSVLVYHPHWREACIAHPCGQRNRGPHQECITHHLTNAWQANVGNIHQWISPAYREDYPYLETVMT